MRHRLLVITSSFPRNERDLAGHFVEQWARALGRHGWHIDVLCWRGQGTRNRRLSDNLSVRFVPYAWRGAEGLFFGAGAPENLSKSPVRALLAVPAMGAMLAAGLKACRRSNYDRIVGHWMVPGGAIARALGAMMGIESLVVGHSGGVHLVGRIPRVARRRLVQWLTTGMTTVPTDPLREKLESWGAVGPVELAPMGFARAFDRMRCDRELQSPLQLGFLGRLVPIKGLPTVLKAVKRLRNEDVDLELTVVGDGPSKVRWRAQSGEGVRFIGARYGTRKWEEISRWQGFVMPSEPRHDGRHEGLPVSLLEASSVGAIPLVSGVPGVEPWLVRPTEQVLPVAQVDAWCRALRWLAELTAQERNQLQRATRRAVAPLAWSSYGQWWAEQLARP